MHMMQMVGITTSLFFISLVIMCFFREKLESPLVNNLFIIANLFFFFCWNYAAFERGWLEDGFMTLENISPFICTVIPLTVFMSDKIKSYAYPAIAYLGFGMFCAMMISPEHEYLFNYNQQATFLHVSEAACHMGMALYGFYLVLSGKVIVNINSWIKSTVFMFASIFFGTFLNLCFHTRNFGMDMYGNYSIYFIDIFGSFEITFIAYLLGVFAVLTFGLLTSWFVEYISRKKHPTLLSATDNTDFTVTTDLPTNKTTDIEK